jgi:hypothetical protein
MLANASVGVAMACGAAPSAKNEADAYYRENKHLVVFESTFWEPIEASGSLKCQVRYYESGTIIIPGDNFCTVEVVPEGKRPIRLTLETIAGADTMSVTRIKNGGTKLSAGNASAAHVAPAAHRLLDAQVITCDLDPTVIHDVSAALVGPGEDEDEGRSPKRYAPTFRPIQTRCPRT